MKYALLLLLFALPAFAQNASDVTGLVTPPGGLAGSGAVTQTNAVPLSNKDLTSASNKTLVDLQRRRAANIANWLKGPMIIAPAWAATTAYVVGNVVTVANGQHIMCGAAGTSGSSTPVYSSSVLTGRPLTDGTVTWYGMPWIKSASDATAPTLTTASTMAGLGLTTTVLFSGTTINPAVTVFGATPVVYASSYIGGYGFAAGNSSYAGNANNDAITYGGQSASYGYNLNVRDTEFYVTDSVVGLQFGNNSTPVVIEVDGQPVNGNAPIAGGVSGWSLKLDFNGVVKRRLVRILDAHDVNLAGVGLTTLGYIEPSDTPHDALLVLGDSIPITNQPFGNDWDGYPVYYLKRFLGVGQVISMAITGSGYVSFNANTFTTPQVLSNPVNQTLIAAYNPTHVLIESGFNDRASSWATVGPAALATWQAVRALLPNAKITITDGNSGNSGPDSAAITLAANLAALFATWNDPNSRFIQAVGAGSKSSYVYGVGTANATLVVGNASDYIGTGTHFNTMGSYYWAQRTAADMQTAWGGSY